jgi:hypothetical protein
MPRRGDSRGAAGKEGAACGAGPWPWHGICAAGRPQGRPRPPGQMPCQAGGRRGGGCSRAPWHAACPGGQAAWPRKRRARARGLREQAPNGSRGGLNEDGPFPIRHGCPRTGACCGVRGRALNGSLVSLSGDSPLPTRHGCPCTGACCGVRGRVLNGSLVSLSGDRPLPTRYGSPGTGRPRRAPGLSLAPRRNWPAGMRFLPAAWTYPRPRMP